MRTFLLSLLAAALSLPSAYSLKCYQCYLASSNGQCQNADTCPASNNSYCMTAVSAATFGSISATAIIKQCAPACTAGKGEIYGVKVTTSCCNTDLCNVSGATSVQISFLTLVISAGFISTLLRAGL